MKKSKYICFLSSLNEEILVGLAVYIKWNAYAFPGDSRFRSPALFQVIQANRKKIEAGKMGKEGLFALTAPDLEYNEGLFKKWLTHLQKASEMFLVQDQIDSNPAKKSALLLSAMNHFEVDNKSISSILRKAKTTFLNPHNRPEDFLHQFEILHASCLFQGRTQGIRKPLVDLIPSIHSLNDYYLVQSLKLACAVLAQKQIGGKEDIPEENILFFKALEDRIPDKAKVIQAYYWAYKLLDNESEGDPKLEISASPNPYDQLYAIQLGAKDEISTEDSIELWSCLLNFCIKCINSGDHSWAINTLYIYNHLFQATTQIKSPEFLSWHFKNYLSLLFMMDKRSMFGDFSQKMKLKYKGETGIQIKKFTLAQIAFWNGQYQTSIDLLEPLLVGKADVFYKLNARVLLAKCHYNLDDFATLENLLFAFRKFIVRQQNLQKDHKAYYSSFISSLEKFLTFTSGKVSGVFVKEARKYKTSLLSGHQIVEREWLLEILKVFVA